jgi:hypothetical protein
MLETEGDSVRMRPEPERIRAAKAKSDLYTAADPRRIRFVPVACSLQSGPSDADADAEFPVRLGAGVSPERLLTNRLYSSIPMYLACT